MSQCRGNCPNTRNLTSYEIVQSLQDYFSLCGTKESSRNSLRVSSGDSVSSLNVQSIAI